MFTSERKNLFILIGLSIITGTLLLGYAEKMWSNPTHGYEFCEKFEIDVDGRKTERWSPDTTQIKRIKESIPNYDFVCVVKTQPDSILAIFWDRGEFSYSGYKFVLKGNTVSYAGPTVFNYKKIE